MLPSALYPPPQTYHVQDSLYVQHLSAIDNQRLYVVGSVVSRARGLGLDTCCAIRWTRHTKLSLGHALNECGGSLCQTQMRPQTRQVRRSCCGEPYTPPKGLLRASYLQKKTERVTITPCFYYDIMGSETTHTQCERGFNLCNANILEQH